VERNAGIDLLRGFAVLLVVLHHIHLRFRLVGIDVSNLLPAALERVIFQTGYQSVIAFFVISGFLITTLSLKRWEPRLSIPLGAFYRLRAARIVPLLLLLLVVASALHLLAVPGFVIKPEVASLPRALVAALGMHVNWLEGHRGYLPGHWDILWSLSIEETFYLAFPLVCLLLRGPWLIAAPLALIASGPISRTAITDDPWSDYAWLSCYDGLAFGVLAALFSWRYPPSRTTLRGLLLVGLTATALVIVARETTFALGLPARGLDITLLEAGVACMLIAFQAGVGTRPLMWTGTSLVRLSGRLSYEIYLSHMLIVLPATTWFFATFGARPSHALILTTYALLLTITVLIGWLVAQYVSEPANRRLRARTSRDEGVAVLSH
jgi:peptidoglycan/LPS O-acetylase OafA/YrhL